MSEKKLGWGIISTANIAKWAVIPALQASNHYLWNSKILWQL